MNVYDVLASVSARRRSKSSVECRHRPTIAVSGPDGGGEAAWLFTSRAVVRSGGHPIRVTPKRVDSLRTMHGLILGGGADVGGGDPIPSEAWRPPEDPAGESRARTSTVRRMVGYALPPLVFIARRALGVRRERTVDSARDNLENQLLARAVADDLPVLGICRGAQLINVFFGGTLHRDLSSFYAEATNPWTVFPRKRIRIEPGSRLKTIIELDDCSVNSLHRNAIANVGAGLIVSAREANGIVQAIERSDRRFLIGVQWHPEYLPQRLEHQRLFDRLIAEACRAQPKLQVAS